MASRNTPRVELPTRGVSDKYGTEDQPGAFVPPASMRNVMPKTGANDEPRMGRRFGLTKLFKDQFGGGKPVQAFATVERAAGISGTQPGPRQVPDADSRIATALTGHCFVIDAVTSMIVAIKDNNAVGGLAFDCAWHPDETVNCVAFLTITTVAGQPATSINLFNMNTRGVVWNAVASLPGVPCLANQVAVGTTYTFVVANEFIWVYKTSDGTFCKKYDIDGWAYECLSVAIRPDGKVAVGFWGTGKVGTLPNQPVLPQGIAESSFYRSGIALFTVNTNTPAEPLTRVRFGPALATTDPWYEADHGYARLGELLNRGHRGAIPYSMAVGPTNEIVLGITNKGWGWNDTYEPDDISTAKTSIAVFDEDGYLLYEKDVESATLAYTGAWGTFYNDIPLNDATHNNPPGTQTPKPSSNAIAVDSDGNYYVAGRRNNAGYSVFKMSEGEDGSVQWRYDSGYVVEQHCIALDPTDGNLWVAVMRNNVYGGATANAILLKLNTIDGTLLRTYDIAPVPTYGAWGIAVNSRGEVAFTTDYI
jgi:hypothetical protein